MKVGLPLAQRRDDSTDVGPRLGQPIWKNMQDRSSTTEQISSELLCDPSSIFDIVLVETGNLVTVLNFNF